MAALAVLWSVFRLYYLLKPSALASEEEYAERQSLLSTTWTKETDRQLRGCLRQFSLMFNMLNRGIGAVWLLVSTKVLKDLTCRFKLTMFTKSSAGVGRGSKRGAPRNLIDAPIRHATMPDTTHLAKILS